MSITPKMIEAGFKAHARNIEEPNAKLYASIYEAMEQTWIQEARKLEKYIPVIPETHSHR